MTGPDGTKRLTLAELNWLELLYRVVPHGYGASVRKVIAFARQADEVLFEIETIAKNGGSGKYCRSIRSKAHAARLKPE